MDKPNSKYNMIKIPRYSPNTPPKDYNEKKAISIFCCIGFSFGFKCPELLRATITGKDDVYVIPFTEYGLGDFHLSYHKSGRFHWTYEQTHTQPVCGETDFAAAFGVWLKVKHPLCFCFRKGKKLSDKEVVSLLQSLAQNFPFNFDVQHASQNLMKSNFYRLVSADLKQ